MKILTCLTCTLFLSIAGALGDEQTPKDYSGVDLTELRIEAVKPSKDPKTGFVVGGANPTGLIRSLTEINGISIAELEKSMRPNGLSSAGFIGEKEQLLDVMAGDNDLVVSLGLNHQEIGLQLRVLAALALKSNSFVYKGVNYRAKLQVTRGFQESPFKDGTKGNTDVELTNIDNDTTLKYSLLVPLMVERYGFYEGKGTPYRVDPKRIVKVLSFLETEQEAQQDGADQPATARETQPEGKEKPKPESKGRSQ
jgi:hypothetical protein